MDKVQTYQNVITVKNTDLSIKNIGRESGKKKIKKKEKR